MEFEQFYELTSDIYQDDLDMAYDHYTELVVDGESDMYSEEDLFEDFLEMYGDSFEDLDEAAEAFLEVYSDEDEEFDFDDEDMDFDDEDFDFEDEDEEYSDLYSLEDVYSSVMEEFYAYNSPEDFETIEDYLYAEDKATEEAAKVVEKVAEDVSGKKEGLWSKTKGYAKKGGQFAKKNWIGGASGAAVGTGAGYLATKKMRARIAELKSKRSLSPMEVKELKKLKRNVALAMGGGAVLGTGAGFATQHYGTKWYNNRKAKKAAKDTNNSYLEDIYEDDFYSDFYDEAVATPTAEPKRKTDYMGTAKAMGNEAWGKVKGAGNYMKENWKYGAGGAAVGAGAGLLMTRKIRARISELKSKPNLSQAEVQELKRLRGQLARTVALSTAGGVGAGYLAQGGVASYNRNKQYKADAPVEDKKADLYSFLEVDEYMDELEMYSENVDATVAGEKKGIMKKLAPYKKHAMIGAAGGVVGGVVGAMTSKDQETRRRLKARINAGVASQAEIDRYKQLVGDRTKRILIGTGAGIAAGAGGTSLFNKFTKKAEADLNDSKNTPAPKKAAADVDVSKDTNNSYYGDIDSDVEDRVYSATVKASQSHETIAKLLTSK